MLRPARSGDARRRLRDLLLATRVRALSIDCVRAPRYEAGTLRYSTLGLFVLIGWLLVGELGIAMRDRAVMPSSLEVLRRYGASNHMVSVLLSGIPALLSLVMTPLIGPASDRLRSRWGRRRPYLVVLAPLGGLALLGIAASSQLGMLLADVSWMTGSPLDHVLTVFAVCWTIFAGVMLCVQALYMGLINDVLPRAWLGRFFGLYRVVSLGVGIGFYLWIFPLLDEQPNLVIALIAVVFAGMIMLMCAMVREGEYPPPPPAPAPVASGAQLERARASMAKALSLPGGGWVYGALILGGLSLGPFNTFSQYYAESLGTSKTELGQLSSLAYGVSMALALFIGMLVDRLGAVRVSLYMMILYSAAISVGYIALADAGSFSMVYMLHVILSGAYFTAAASLPMVLFPRLDFLRFCAFRDLLGSSAGIALSFAQGAVLDRSGHDYRLTVLFAAVCSALCALCLARLAWDGQGLPERERSA